MLSFVEVPYPKIFWDLKIFFKYSTVLGRSWKFIATLEISQQFLKYPENSWKYPEFPGIPKQLLLKLSRGSVNLPTTSSWNSPEALEIFQ